MLPLKQSGQLDCEVNSLGHLELPLGVSIMRINPSALFKGIPSSKIFLLIFGNVLFTQLLSVTKI
jgi:hypothetical protein